MGFRNACTGKQAHKSWHSAEKNRRSMDRRRRRGELNVYRCQICGLYHVGHRPEYRKRPLRVYAEPAEV